MKTGYLSTALNAPTPRGEVAGTGVAAAAHEQRRDACNYTQPTRAASRVDGLFCWFIMFWKLKMAFSGKPRRSLLVQSACPLSAWIVEEPSGKQLEADAVLDSVAPQAIGIAEVYVRPGCLSCWRRQGAVVLWRKKLFAISRM